MSPEPPSEAVARSRHAGLIVRAAAAFLDLVAMGIPAYIFVSVFFDFGWMLEADMFSGASNMNVVLLAVVTIILLANWDGRTPGKKLMRIRIVTFPDYQPFSYGTATVRTLVGAVSALTLVGYIVIAFMVALRQDKRGYHDMIARTCVVHD